MSGATMTEAGMFGALLARFRRRTGRSQGTVADRAGVTRSHISRLEAGERLPGRETTLALAAALDLDRADRAALCLAAGYLPDDPIVDEIVRVLLAAGGLE